MTRRGHLNDYHCTQARGFIGPGSLRQSSSHTGTSPPPVPPLLDIPFVGTPLVGCQFAGFIVNPTQKKWDHSSSGSLSDLCYKQTHVDSQEAEVGSKHSALASESRHSSEPHRQEPTSHPSSPTKATADLGNSAVVGTSRSSRDQCQLQWDLI